MSGMRAKNEKKFSISRRETQVIVRLLPSFPTTIGEILAIFSRRTISCKGLFSNHSFFIIRGYGAAVKRLHTYFLFLIAFPMLMVASLVLAAENPSDAGTQTKATSFPVCDYIASYTPGYFWQAEETAAIQKTLRDVCQLNIFYMNSKAIHDPKHLQQIGQQAREFIEQYPPDVIISSDDNAMKYVIQPYFKNSTIPVVFCGINSTGKPYGLPYHNTTGMIEKLAIDSELFRFAKQFSLNTFHKEKFSLAFLTIPTTTEKQNIRFLKQKFHELQINFDVVQVHSVQQWNRMFIQLNQDKTHDFIILGNYQPLARQWNPQKEQHLHLKYAKKPIFSYLKSLQPYSHLTFLKSATEQGLWAGKTAKLILQKGYQPSDIQIVPNRLFKLVYNQKMIEALPTDLKTAILAYINKNSLQ